MTRTARIRPTALLLAAALSGCGTVAERGPADAALSATIDASLDRAVKQYTAMDETLPDSLFPRTLNEDGTLQTNRSSWWTSGFFPGSLWYLYEYTGDPALKERALDRTRAVEREKLNDGDHDIGFKIYDSFGNALRLTGDTTFASVMMTAARTLTTRFEPRVGAIRSWGARGDTTGPYLVIIDNMMNLELLFWASRHSGDPRFAEIAVAHADKTLANHFRPDGSSYHVLEYDPLTGEVDRKRTAQGHADASAWSRGQAWGLYGFTVAYRETGFDRYLEQAKAIAGFMIPRLPEDGLPYWDFDAPDIPDALRDASAGAITASALLELGGFVGDSLRDRYRDVATTILTTLGRPPYRAAVGENGNFLLKHGVGSLPAESEVDVPLSYADYYYIEGLMRLRRLLRGEEVSIRVLPIGDGWARSSVNAAVFRRSGLLSHGDAQFAAFYDPEGRMVLARRATGGGRWETRRTRYSGNVRDAHNAISLGVDGGGTLHVSWDLHGDSLRYARSVRPGSLDLTDPLPMTGADELEVTYPQFYAMPDGDLLFVYRDGASGDGDVMLNRYDATTGRWHPLQHPLIDGEGERNAYVNTLAVDSVGGVHVSWTWRETWDVSTNHDILYAYSPDGGATWERSTGEPYTLPITASRAEVAVRVPEAHDLINQTTMTVDGAGRPYIATYWRADDADVPQFRVVWNDGSGWRGSVVGRRSTPFSLAGGGTKRIPVSRPLVLAGDGGAVYVVFRDFERGGGVSLAGSTDPARDDWRVRELYAPSVGLWEPVHDPVAWARDRRLSLLVQRVGQGDAETLEDLPAQPVKVIEWIPEAS